MRLRAPNKAKNDHNRYCGPAVISSLTGMTTGEAARLIRHRTGKQSVTATYTHEVRGALSECGLQMTPIYTSENLTLAGWLKESVTYRKAGVIFLISAGHHWQLVSGRRYTCGRIEEIVSIKDKQVKRRARVRAVWRIDLLPGYDKPVIPAEARKPKATIDRNRVELKRLEKLHGFRGKVEHDGGYSDYVVPPCAFFPEGFQTLHYSWEETLGRVETCIEDPSLVEDGCYSE